VKARWAGLTLTAVVILAAQPVYAFKLLGAKWPSPTTTMFADFGSNLFNDAFDNAASRWVQATGFDLQVSRQLSDPCAGYSVSPDDTRNGTAFKPDACGPPWGQGDLAVTLSLCKPDCSPSGTITEADTVFNYTENWSVYPGPWQDGVSDFRRVAVHELGHVIGLAHEDSVPAIMQTFVFPGNDIESPLPDDIAGVAAIYGQLRPVASLSLNQAGFHTGDPLVLNAQATPGPSPTQADVYIVLQPPGCSSLACALYWQGDLNFIATPQPILHNWPVSPFNGPIFSHTFAGTEPVGSYVWLGFFTVPETLNVIGATTQAPFSFSP
jgi:hypothetical protein